MARKKPARRHRVPRRNKAYPHSAIMSEGRPTAQPGSPSAGGPGPSDSTPTHVTATLITSDACQEHIITDPHQVTLLREQPGLLWINVDGLEDPEVVRGLGALFQLHPLALEDVINIHQRAKVEDYSGHTFIVVRMPVHGRPVHTEQVSMFLGERFVITFQERPGGDCLEPLRQRLRKAAAGARVRATSGFLAYAIIDAIVDGFFPLLEDLGDSIESMEEAAVAAQGPHVIQQIHDTKADLIVLRRAIWPLREALNLLVRDEQRFIHAELRPYFRDCHDHTVQLLELIETYRELVADSRDLYMSGISNRLNEIMKVLTVISTVFIPLNFVAGVYGMNFHTEISPWNMPELNWTYGYPMVLTLMLIISLGLLGYFWRLGWLGTAAGLPNETS